MNKCNTKEIDFSSRPNPSILASIAPLSFERKKGTISVFPEFKVIRHLLTNTLHCMPYIRFLFFREVLNETKDLHGNHDLFSKALEHLFQQKNTSAVSAK